MALLDKFGNPKPVIRRSFSIRRGKFEWIAVPMAAGGFSTKTTPGHLMAPAYRHAHKLNEEEACLKQQKP